MKASQYKSNAVPASHQTKHHSPVTRSSSNNTLEGSKVYIFVTCLVNMFRPNVGFATVALLEQAGFNVEVPARQVCCGQPAYNNGCPDKARQIAKTVIKQFEQADYVVVPSGSCASMLIHHLPKLFPLQNENKPQADGENKAWRRRAKALAGKTFELTQFLVDVAGIETLPHTKGSFTVHDSCAGLRELGVKQQPRQLLKAAGVDSIREHDQAETCCGFGGTFCVKYPEISYRMASRKVASINESGADTVIATDLGCLMNLSGTLSRQGITIEARHIAEVLHTRTDTSETGTCNSSGDKHCHSSDEKKCGSINHAK